MASLVKDFSRGNPQMRAAIDLSFAPDVQFELGYDNTITGFRLVSDAGREWFRNVPKDVRIVGGEYSAVHATMDGLTVESICL